MKSKCKTCKHCSFYQVVNAPPNGEKVVTSICEKYLIRFSYSIRECNGYEKGTK